MNDFSYCHNVLNSLFRAEGSSSSSLLNCEVHSSVFFWSVDESWSIIAIRKI